jgi:hypothetical protein
VPIWLDVLIVAAAVAVAVAAKLLVRLRAPEGLFTDSSRSASTFGALSTMFALILAFVIVLAVESFTRARERSGVEAVAVTSLASVIPSLPETGSPRLRGELLCYARAVVHQEWPAMRDGDASPVVEGWIDRMARRVDAMEPRTAAERTADSAWFDRDSVRRDGRRGRLAEAPPFVPLPLWGVLILGGMLMVVYMVFHADRRERGVSQGVAIGTVTALIAAAMLVVVFLDRPYSGQPGSVRPNEMEHTIALLEQERLPIAPCDAEGKARL